MRRVRGRRLRAVDENVTPEFVVALYERYVRHDADVLAAPYLGRYIRVRGRIGDVVGVRKTTIVRFVRGAESSSVRIEMLFRGRDAELSLHSGDRATIVGAIRGVVRGQITLDHCRVIDARRADADAE